jgi:hypothetical protein
VAHGTLSTRLNHVSHAQTVLASGDKLSTGQLPALGAEGCRALEGLRGLRSLCVEMVIGDVAHRQDATMVDDDSLVAILEPLNRVAAPLFKVEINLAVNEMVRERLGEMAFTIVVKSRPYDTILFP